MDMFWNVICAMVKTFAICPYLGVVLRCQTSVVDMGYIMDILCYPVYHQQYDMALSRNDGVIIAHQNWWSNPDNLSAHATQYFMELTVLNIAHLCSSINGLLNKVGTTLAFHILHNGTVRKKQDTMSCILDNLGLKQLKSGN